MRNFDCLYFMRAMVDTAKVSAYRGKYLRVNLPGEVVSWLDLKAGDILIFRPVKRNGKKVIIVEKLE